MTDRELIDRADFRGMDANRPASHRRVTMKVSAAADPADAPLVGASACVRLLHAIGVEETDVKRRELLFELALVLGGSKALELLRVLTLEEEERLAGVLRSTWRVDETAVHTFEKLTMHARRADDASGPAALLPVVNEHRAVVGRLLARESMPTGLRDRLLGTYVQLSQLAGFLAYDLRDYQAAEQPLNDGLRAALDLGDPPLVGYMHYWPGRAAAEQDRPAAVLDHAFAALVSGPSGHRANCWGRYTKDCFRSAMPLREMLRRVAARMNAPSLWPQRRRTTNRASSTGSHPRQRRRGGPGRCSGCGNPGPRWRRPSSLWPASIPAKRDETVRAGARPIQRRLGPGQGDSRGSGQTGRGPGDRFPPQLGSAHR
ncbi:hypothetical protein [Nonomuraea rosea]|uniref:hypothetical protein n=1 Tax=Nonomuraea rosea TaxID=638574 RepID=UPI0031E536CD